MTPPSGIVTFLFTDIEGSTRFWEAHPREMQAALAWHDSLLRALIEQHDGYVFKTVGDAFCAAFPSGDRGVQATLAIQQRLRAAEPLEPGQARGPGLPSLRIRVRMGLHTGAAQERDNDYFGPTLNRCARLQSLAAGAQVLLSRAAADAVGLALPDGAELLPLGTHGLKDLNAPEEVFQLAHPDLPREFPALRSVNAFPQNLPQQTTSLVGRELEVQAVQKQLTTARLVTLIGPGGTGKTRLSLQVGAESLEQFPDGVWFLEFAPLSDPLLLPYELAGVLKLREEDAGPGGMEALLAEYLRSRKTLLILDNCEHVIEGCARLVGGLLRQCSHLRVLASSREPLFVAGERLHRVPSLLPPDPDTDRRSAPERLRLYAGNPAVRLFLERAAAVRPDFTLTDSNGDAVARICRRLDGLPLAIELAAARVRAMPAEQIAARLDDMFRLLTGGSRTGLPHHQTLRATIDWSYDRLSEEERALFARLSVFAMDWSLEAAEAVCSDPETPEPGAPEPTGLDSYAVLDLLAKLQDTSLVGFSDREGVGRYGYLQTIRQYARERITSASTWDWLELRRLSYFLRRAQQAGREWHGPEQAHWLAEMERDHENYRSALEYGLSAKAGPGAHDLGAHLADALLLFWEVRSEWSEARSWLERARQYAPPDSELLARLLAGASQMALRQRDFPAARRAAEESLRILEMRQDPRGRAVALNNLANVAAREGDLEGARTCHERSLALEESLGNEHGIAVSLNNLGMTAYQQGDLPAARSYYERALERYRALKDLHETTIALFNLGEVTARQGDLSAARATLAECVELSCRSGGKFVLASALEEAAHVAYREGEPGRAARLWGAAEQTREQIDMPLSDDDLARHHAAVGPAQDSGQEGVFAAAGREGREAGPGDWVRWGRGGAPPAAGP